MGDVEGVNRAYAAWGVTCTFSHPCVNMKTRQVPLKEGVCIFAVAAVVHMFVFIVVSYAAGHGRECVVEVFRVKSADSPLSAMAVVKVPPQGKGECEITFVK